MRDLADPELLEYLKAENVYGDHWFGPLADTLDTLFDEIRSRVQETDLSPPVQFGSWWYATSTTKGSSYPVHHRGPTHERSAEVTLLDENVEAADHEYFDLGAFDLSTDHHYLAWSMDTLGDERYTLRIREIALDRDSAIDLDDEITGVANAGVAWSQDSEWLFYVTADAQDRPHQVWRHRVGTERTTDTCVYEEADERFYVGIGSTRSDAWIVLHSGSKNSSEVRLIPADEPTNEPALVIERRPDIEYTIDHWGDVFVQQTNEDAVDFRVLTAAVEADHADPLSWRELVAHVPGQRIIGVEPFADHLVIQEWVDAQPRVRVLFRDGAQRVVDLGDEPHDVELAANPMWDTKTVRFTSQSLTLPATVSEEDVTTGERMVLRRVPTPNVDLTNYRAERMWATGLDGTRVPVDVVHHVDTPLNGEAPTVLYGYGAYEASIAPWFSVGRLSLLDRGFVWALAHPRGGGELGRQWYLDGRLLAKRNTFDDMIAISEHLIASKVAHPERLAIRGGSAGGLLVGACMVQRPDLFSSVVAEVPFVDVVASMSDTSLPLTVTEWEEWGDPRSAPFASYIQSYSPYDNTVAADYPAIMITAGLNDPRVSVHEPAKWVARLRQVSTGDAPIVLRTDLDGGHGGPTGRYEAWRDEARVLAFTLTTT